MTYKENKILKKLPAHLKQFINNQDYDAYTPVDQAVWRYVMRKNVQHLTQVAHSSYLEGLRKTGISIEKIPNMYGMNRILKDIGWAAVAVDGFIPPSAFMEFQAFNVLVIAEDIRQLKHIEYTPAPDIIHEAAGHAPIIANPEYAEYLRRFGEIGSKAISSAKDFEMYEAVRHISIVKEDPNATSAEIKEAQERVEYTQNNMGTPSEMAKIRNLHWWTVEYGLIGTLENPKIYGAGLLSSIGESKSCLLPAVKKLPYSIAAADLEFDITKPQPQLFVTPDFAYLSFVLEQFANQMALRRGGIYGLNLLIESKGLGTIEYNTGLQVSGHFTEVITDEFNRPIYIKTAGETALSYRDKELIGHGVAYHTEGFGSPIGKLANINIPIEQMSPYDLEAYRIREGQNIKLEFEGGVTVEGEVITGTRNRFGRILLISFKNCTVKYKDEYLFKPEWGVYDMAVGSEIISAYAGPADPKSFDLISHVPAEKMRKRTVTSEQKPLFQKYQEVRDMRENDDVDEKALMQIFEYIKSKHPQEWLILLEIYELLREETNRETVKNYLLSLRESTDVYNLIQEGMALAEEEAIV
ncbi:aromatic amino acid hydroxylase [Flavobacteriaceae bacterium Ap0902]|nr:aromatic amino acid hydroxylase [Flavobacteriaceae bacterium Ap0902]